MFDELVKMLRDDERQAGSPSRRCEVFLKHETPVKGPPDVKRGVWQFSILEAQSHKPLDFDIEGETVTEKRRKHRYI